jgi:hypothetical protein
MRKTLTLLLASAALTVAIGVPVWSAMHTPADGSPRPVAALFEEGAEAMPLVLASDDDDDDGRRYRESSRRGHDDDDDDCGRGARDPAPTGTVAPPQNGLFENGAPPQVQVN